MHDADGRLKRLLAIGLFQVGHEQFDARMHVTVCARAVVRHRVSAGRLQFGAGGTHVFQAHEGGRAGQIERQAEHACAEQGLW